MFQNTEISFAILVFDFSKNQRQTVKAKRKSNSAHSQSFSPILSHALALGTAVSSQTEVQTVFIRALCDMKKISTASIPTLFDPGLYSKDDSESTVVCKGQTAKLHSRNGGLQDEKQVSVSWETNLFT